MLGSEDLASSVRPLDEATTLPARAFTDPEIYAREVERIMRGHWLCVGRIDEVPSPGDWKAIDLLGERLVLVRDQQESLRVLSRVCRHRAAELVTGSGTSRSFQCPYHAWTYGLDGTLIGAPHMEGVRDFERAEYSLPSISMEVWEGFVFVNLDGQAEPLGPSLSPLSEMLVEFDLGSMVAEETGVYESPFNWKVLVDNFMEAYHHIATHKGSLEPLFPGRDSHIPDSKGPYSLLCMPSIPSLREQSHPKIPGLEPDRQPGLVAAVVYPFHLFAPAADQMAWYMLMPESVDRFSLRIYTCFRGGKDVDESTRQARNGMHALTRHIHEEDIGACEAVWSGLRSGRFREGRLSTLEKAIWEFNQWWCARMVE